jgi:hypothetical protein
VSNERISSEELSALFKLIDEGISYLEETAKGKSKNCEAKLTRNLLKRSIRF